MAKLDDARSVLSSLEMPSAQRSDVCCYALLAMAGVGENDSWADATNNWIRIHDIIQFTSDHYGVRYAENSRETIRKQALHHFRAAAIIEDNGKATNSPNYRYRLTEEALVLFKAYLTHTWDNVLKEFATKHDTLVELYSSKKKMQRMPVAVNEEVLFFSAGLHNRLQKLIIEEFASRFAPYSECLYVGDTAEKDLVKNAEKLKALGFSITLHDKMPDVVLYRADKNWIYFIEAVTSVGPMDVKRIHEIRQMTMRVTAGKVYVTAFLDFKTYKRFSDSLAWETEVWIAEMPDHMIHLNGDAFLRPRG
ncbi:MAG: hypothetical protein LBS53_02415 [Synergistaceae bacterium]|jgi:hypothetical protein|nr:hypothetical protein [Synergistaceae bacterium]